MSCNIKGVKAWVKRDEVRLTVILQTALTIVDEKQTIDK